MSTLAEFLAEPAAAVAILPATPHEGAAVGYELPPGFRLRAVRATRMPAVAGVFDEFAAALQFPYYFGANKDAFDECMRELDETVGSAAGYVLLIRDADVLLRDQPAELAWFAEAMAFYAEHWAGAGVAFKVLLQSSAPAAVARAWREAGLEPSVVVTH